MTKKPPPRTPHHPSKRISGPPVAPAPRASRLGKPKRLHLRGAARHQRHILSPPLLAPENSTEPGKTIAASFAGSASTPLHRETDRRRGRGQEHPPSPFSDLQQRSESALPPPPARHSKPPREKIVRPETWTFFKSAPHMRALPPALVPEIAFWGRSNVGKSSLLNLIMGGQAVAKVSKQPGRTQALNFFHRDHRLFLVDLPGYGFARVPSDLQASWQRLLSDYVGQRGSLWHIYLLLDARHEPQPLDRHVIRWLIEQRRRFSFVLTKTDRISPTLCAQRIALLQKDYPGLTVHAVSAKDKVGHTDLVDAITRLTVMAPPDPLSSEPRSSYPLDMSSFLTIDADPLIPVTPQDRKHGPVPSPNSDCAQRPRPIAPAPSGPEPISSGARRQPGLRTQPSEWTAPQPPFPRGSASAPVRRKSPPRPK